MPTVNGTQEKPSFIQTFSKKGFMFIWRLISKLNPQFARKMLYWAINDGVFFGWAVRNKMLENKLFGKTFPNPIGVAAGFDNTFKYNDDLMHIGFGFAEFGTFTFEAQHDMTTLTFLPSQGAILVDVSGYPNPGMKHSQQALINRRYLPHIAGVSISSEIEPKSNQENIVFDLIEDDLIKSTQMVAPYCDFIVLDLSNSSLVIRNLVNNSGQLAKIIHAMQMKIAHLAPISMPGLLVKLPLDISPTSILVLSELFLELKVSGIIVGSYLSSQKEKQKIGNNLKGFICGRPIKDASTYLVKKFFEATRGQIPIIASGGVFTAEDAFEKIQAGASLVQLHTAILYKGPDVANEINRKLIYILKTKGYKNISEAIGSSFF